MVFNKTVWQYNTLPEERDTVGMCLSNPPVGFPHIVLVCEASGSSNGRIAQAHPYEVAVTMHLPDAPIIQSL